MKIDLSSNIEILVLTGPESSGKTTTAKRLSEANQLPLVTEYAREYLNLHGPEYTFDDIQKIAAVQIENELEANRNNSLIICDTDIITLEIWALEKYGTSLAIQDGLALKKHYLLCYPDITWEPDPLRENPEDRIRLFEIYKARLIDFNLPFIVLNASDRIEFQLKK